MKPDIMSMTGPEIEQFVLSIGEARFRAAQLHKWLMHGTPVEDMTNIPAKMKEKLNDLAFIPVARIEEKQVSKDGTVKYLFRLWDDCYVETVYMHHNYGNTVCVSSQSGCRMGCKFCASTVNGLTRSLTASEMLLQITEAIKDMGEGISNIVIMGMGEPFDNYEQAVRFIRLCNSEDGLNISCRRISVSTCGIVPGILEFAREGLPVTLSVSLHAPDDETRSEIMPINRKYGVAELLDACREYYAVSKRRISFEYALIDGKNNSPEDAAKLADVLKRHLKDSVIHVNLIPVNAVRESGFTTGGREKTERFVKELEKRGINATVRKRMGSDINASCGQLRAKKLPGINQPPVT